MEWFINAIMAGVLEQLGLSGGLLLAGFLLMVWLYREERRDRRALQSDLKDLSERSVEATQRLREVVIEIRAKL